MNESLFQYLFEEVAEPRPVTVSELNAEIKRSVDDAFGQVWVEGEIVNYRQTGPGHCYFSLNDGVSQIKAVIWKSTGPRVRFEPKNGMNVQIRGRLTYWAQKGELKLQVDSMRPAGEGSLAIAFEQVRARLEQEGLFATDLKRAIPRFPRRVGVVTSMTGAAFADIVHVLSRRAASVSIVLFPATVQGDLAPDEICTAIDRANRLHAGGESIDVLIVGRGGGSAEDLWAFNDERLARAIRASGIPVISAVGHEIDTTIADLIADLRAPTPPAAAEIVAHHEDEIRSLLQRSESELIGLLGHRLRYHDFIFNEAERRFYASFGSGYANRAMHAESLIERLSINLVKRHVETCTLRRQELHRRLGVAVGQTLERANAAVGKAMLQLDAMSPLRVLDRGYSVTQTSDGQIVSRANQVVKGELLRILLADGKLDATVTSVREERDGRP